jgi:hypothetical protein
MLCGLLAVLLLMVSSGLAQQTEEQGEIANNSAQDIAELNMAERDVRDPFWPVGYYPEWWLKRNQPEAEEDVVKRDKWAEAREQVRISGMSRMGSSGYFAVINGRTMSRGDVVTVEYEGVTYRWILADIGQEGVRLSRLDEE